MPAQWTGRLIGEMHLNGVTAKQLAAKAGYTAEYVSMILNGHRQPKNAEQTLWAALNSLIVEQKQDSA